MGLKARSKQPNTTKAMEANRIRFATNGRKALVSIHNNAIVNTQQLRLNTADAVVSSTSINATNNQVNADMNTTKSVRTP